MSCGGNPRIGCCRRPSRAAAFSDDISPHKTSAFVRNNVVRRSMCSANSSRRLEPQRCTLGHSSSSPRPMNEMNHWWPETIAKLRRCRECCGLNRIDTTLVSSRRTLTSTGPGGGAGFPELPYETHRPRLGSRDPDRATSRLGVWRREPARRVRAIPLDRPQLWPRSYFSRDQH